MMMPNGTELKASTVLQAMVTGLRNAKHDPNFVIKMTTFGLVSNQLCYGCCATVTLAEMFGQGKSPSELMFKHANTRGNRSNSTHTNLSEVIELEPLVVQDGFPITLENLEHAVDDARSGDVSNLIDLLTGDYNKSFDDEWYLSDDNWEEQLPKVEKTIAEMIEAGY